MGLDWDSHFFTSWVSGLTITICNKITAERCLGTRQPINNYLRGFYKSVHHNIFPIEMILLVLITCSIDGIEAVWRKLMFITLGPNKVKLHFTHTSRWTLSQLREKVLEEILKRTGLNTSINWKRIIPVTVTKCIPNKLQTLTQLGTQQKVLLVHREIHIQRYLVPLILVQESKKSWRTASMCVQLPLNLALYTWNQKR